MASTLILNADFTPLSLIPISSITWKDAIKISFLGHANAVEYYDDWEIHSPSTTLSVPAVMVSTIYIKKKQTIRFSRNNLLIRDNFTCQYCEKRLNSWDLTVDHVVPRVKGGKTKWENVAASCSVCNSIKGHRSKMKPIRQPKKPDYYQLIDNIKQYPIKVPCEKWIQYLNWDEKLITVVPTSRN